MTLVQLFQASGEIVLSQVTAMLMAGGFTGWANLEAVRLSN
jgi:hypothetical protein